MSRHKCTKDLYKAFLQASSVRYSGLALSDVSPSELSHDSISRWLKDSNFSPKNIWSISKNMIDTDEACLLITDDTVLSKTHSKKIDLVNYQYSGNAHDVIAGIGLINLVWPWLYTGRKHPAYSSLFAHPFRCIPPTNSILCRPPIPVISPTSKGVLFFTIDYILNSFSGILFLFYFYTLN